MSTTSNSASLDSLRQSIEDLSLEVALSDLRAPERMKVLAPMLAQIGAHAESAGKPILAELAAQTPATEAEWHQAVARMQQFIDEPVAVPVPVSLNQDPELVADFVLESREHLSTVETQLLALEQNPRDAEAINTIFRGFHTIKGLAGFLEFGKIQRFAHEVETLLDLARTAVVTVDSDLIDLILKSADYMSHCLCGVETGVQPTSDLEPLISSIQAMIEGVKFPAAGPAQPSERVLDAVRHAPSEVESLGTPAAPVRPAAADQELACTPETAEAARPVAAAQAGAGGPRAVKVDTSKLDYLVDMVGELVIAQSMIRHDPDLSAVHSQKLTRNLAQLTRITGDVQRVAMAMRLHPVNQLFQRMARLVRDLARQAGKQVNLELSGEDTELDRNLVEELADPLMHMIRNAVDHGVELPEERIKAGKNPIARIDLRAYHQAGFINIDVSDDGRGLAREKLLEKARQRGLLSGGDHLTDQEVFGLIFEPGFSTASQVTDVSGRGVGMDVVRKQISKLRGRIEINSQPGRGTTFILKLPLTLAIIEGLVVGVGEQRYIVPMFAVKEMFRPGPDSLSTVPGGGEMVLVRGSLLPILRLHSRFGVEPKSVEPSQCVFVVVESACKKFCVLVDELIGKQEVVIKSLGETFRNVTGVAGGSILGDGRVGLILDVETLYGSHPGD